MNWSLRQKMKNVVYNLIRPLFVRGTYEDHRFFCKWCTEPLLTREHDFCSDSCQEVFAWFDKNLHTMVKGDKT
jgi:hypothetical protein